MSVDYLVRLEQGRDTHPSAEVLAALADAMRMSEDERRHLFHLGVKSGNEALCPARSRCPRGRADVIALLDALAPTPAFVLGPAGDVLAGTMGGRRSPAGSACSMSHRGSTRT